MRKRMALTTFLLAASGGIIGFRLVPDTDTYASGVMFPYGIPLPSLGGLLGQLGGLPLLIVVGSAAAALCSYYVERWLFVALSIPIVIFPGVDALGASFVLLSVVKRRTIYGVLSIFAHPVSFLTGWPFILRFIPRRLAVILSATCALAVMSTFTYRGYTTDISVDVAHHFLYTARYLFVTFTLGMRGAPLASANLHPDPFHYTYRTLR